MTSRSVRRRLARRPGRPVRVYGAPRENSERGLPHVTVSVTDFATRVSQTFLILPNAVHTATLTGYIETSGLPRVFKVPVEIRARVT